MEEKKEFLRVDVKGKNTDVWARIRSKFIDQIEYLLNFEINHEDGTSVKDEAKDFVTQTIKFAKEKLKQPGYENMKMLAEIDEIYTKSQLNRTENKIKEAEARIKNVEARNAEFQERLRNMKLSMRLSKAMLVKDETEDSIVFLKEIDTLLEIINEFELKGIQ